MSDYYPPGVTGNEYETAGPDREVDERVQCSSCLYDGIEFVTYFRDERWWTCSECGYDNAEYGEV